MTVALIVLDCLVVIGFLGLGWMLRSLLKQLYDRQGVLDKHLKAVSHKEQRVLLDAQELHENARLLHERVDQHFADPQVKRWIADGR